MRGYTKKKASPVFRSLDSHEILLSGIQAWVVHVFEMIQALGPWAPWVYLIFYIAASIFFISNPLLFLAAGALFGAPLGFVVISAGALVSAAVVFLMGRYWSRGWITKNISGNAKIMAVDEAVSERGWLLVFLLRFTAILPFSVMNYALGLSKIRFRDYALATWLGMMPGIFMYVTMGSLAGKAIFQEGPRRITPAEWLFCGLSMAVTVGISVYAALEVRKILKKSESIKK